MELFDSSLNDYLKTQRLEESEIRKIFTMICVSVFFIHKNGIIHRDLKPDNILMKKIGNQNAFVLTDFGVAKNNNIKYTVTVKAFSELYSS
jgi:eukaryotic-like serine/threonine-protein kinase